MTDKSDEKPQPAESGRPRRRLLRILAWSTAAVLVLCAGAGGYVYWRLNSNLRTVDISGALGSDRPGASGSGTMNILLLGSDSRSGSNGQLAGGAADGTARSDTAMVIHVNQAHDHADIVSIPRDTLVSRPSCPSVKGGTAAAADGAMFNTAYEVGGPACAVKTVESMTGLRMDHYVELDFSGFAKLIDALGGVTVTTTVPIDDQKSGLHLAAGTHTLNGTQALAFVRTRHGVGDGSDLGRIELQQQMMKSILTKVEGMGLLSDPVKLLDIADTATSALTTDSQLGSVTSLVSLAEGMRGIGDKDITAVTMPTVVAPSDPNRLVALDPQAADLWAALALDQPVPASVLALQLQNPATSPTPAAGPSASSGAGPSASGTSSDRSPE
ncbi:LCP family protein [Streptacidiphilus cavernicola]|uniref:LCP family protein n=1 Tax=Streptacidiphilus cavernicola TaxID=3342716 RepID=A0ABV6VUJ3_9ACTN